MRLKWILLIIVIGSAGAQAQEATPRQSSDDQPQSVTNDDRGRAFIITGDVQPLSSPSSHGKVIVEPQQNSIFLGRGWDTASLRAREPQLANLLASIRDQTQLSALDERGVKNFLAATASQERFDEVAGDRSEERRVGKECRSRWSPY